MAFDDGLGIPRRQESNGADNRCEEQEINRAVQSQRFDVFVVLFDSQLGLRRIVQAIKRIVGEEKDPKDECPFLPQVQRPREGDTVQETEEERRVAQRGQQTAAVGHDEDRKENGVDLVHTLAVGGKQGTDQQHCRAGCSNERC